MNDIELYRFYVYCTSEQQWYAVMRECRTWFGTNWKCQSKRRRKLKSNWGYEEVSIWFDIPNPTWATWIGTKFALRVVSEDKYKTGK